MDGALYYFILPVRDLDRAQGFFGGVLGWQFAEGGHITSIADPHGGLAVREGVHPQVWLHVEDIKAAVVKIRDLGGESTDMQESPSGWWADCKDAGGSSFSIGRMRPEFDVGEGGATSGRGTLGYFTIPVVDLAIARRFYEAVFGWSYDAVNSSETYAHVARVSPPCGLVVSDDKAVSVWFVTEDVGASVAKVREFGGTFDEPSTSASGQSAACISNDGGHFNLWQPAPGL